MHTPVADVELADGREAMTHVPAMDFGGLLRPGVDMMLRPACHTNGTLVGSAAVGKFGKPKCEFITQLVRVSDPENRHLDPLGVWVGAAPFIAEKLTHEMLKRGLVPELGEIAGIQREVGNLCGTDMRVDFVVTHKDGTRTALEVKKVIDADYDPSVVRAKHERAKAFF